MRVDRHYYPHVTDKETETQESNDMPRPTDKPTEVELETKSSDLKLVFLPYYRLLEIFPKTL